MVFVYTGKGRRGAQKDDAPPEQKLCAKQGWFYCAYDIMIYMVLLLTITYVCL